MAAVTVSRSGDRLIAIKQVAAERAAEIAREADLLRRLDHPGIVRFVDIVDTAEGGRALHTEFVSSDTWATRPLSDPAARAAGMAALAAVVADLHDLGASHLHLTAGHVLHGDNDRPVLCGLARAGEATPENRQTDLDALADLCHDDTIGRGALAGKLCALADASRAGRLGARELARKLDQLLAKRSARPEAARGRHSAPRRALPRLPRRASYAGAALLAAAFAALILSGRLGRVPDAAQDGASALAGQELKGTTNGVAEAHHADSSRAGAPMPVAGPPVSAAATSTPEVWSDPGAGDAGRLAATAVETHAAGSAIGGGPADPTPAQTGASGAEAGEPARLRDAEEAAAGAVLEHGGRRYAIGAQGDLVATGDWDCDGTVAPAIVRPSTGDVALFDGWPGPDETLTMPVRWKIDAPSGIEVVHDGPCDLLRVFTPAGSQLLNPRRTP